ncbi:MULTISPECIES: tripartite tricarboxylate transporter permease [unclassified Pantoea]|uniref:tripartite tricarboxylate transporter permease n=1 Tax=unclassified Pantoea TaxID=2630326 RepID=UPI001CD69DE0|nr:MULTISPECIES: tripartite tricarboxylate transporter permease [unclassified Pantoea]MCA1177355.1 tripartite tricarboxylate transporter permease [Pantoea sp. alder69]MCA1249739.1 tripartite tricarboxylate transporter permease [Pantoea sp. alder70]MCA1265844.1 tripartite tricarboxylate transporter permease [Pantoea sp. alder81]
MELYDHLALGFATAFTMTNLLYALLGCVLGTLIGVLPGLGPVATIAMLLPVTYGMEPTPALIMLASIYYGAQYGGSTTAILVNLPGESSSVVTALDGYQMARQGRAGVALATAGIGSFFAGCVGTLLIALFATPLTALALDFAAADYFSLMIFGLVAAVIMASGSVSKAIGMILIGLLFGTIGTDVNSGLARFTFNQLSLMDGLDFVCIAMGIFGVAEIVRNLESHSDKDPGSAPLTTLWPKREDFRRMWPAILRGTGVGSLLGILPGAGATLASFSSYSLEKRLSKQSHQFGKGAIEGVAGPESANNAAAQTSFIPLLTLGIPSSATMAMMVAALMIHNIQPGPQVMTSNPDLFWGLIVSMWLGNLILVILNLPMVGIWARLLRVPYRWLYPLILMFCCIGVFSIKNSVDDLWQMLFFGLLGYGFARLKLEAAPLMLGFVLGPLLEENFRRALLLSRGDFSVFFSRPISATLLVAALGLILLMCLPRLNKSREEVFQE